MTHPLSLRYWRGFPGIVAAAYIVIVFFATPDRILAVRVAGGVGGAFIMVATYWAWFRLWARIWPWAGRRRRRSKSKSVDD